MNTRSKLDPKVLAGLERYIDEHYRPEEELTLRESRRFYSERFGEIWLEEVKPGFSQTVIAMAKEKYGTVARFCQRSLLTKQVASLMTRDPDYLPKKPNAFACVVALELSPEEAEEVLRRGSYTFSESSLLDVFVRYFLSVGVYDIDEINIVLEENDLPLLGCV